MLSISDDDLEKINAILSQNNQLDSRIIEKDILMTRVIIALSKMDIKNVYLIFCGGTCLSKGYALINRMSEDIDFKLKIDIDLSASQARKKRSEIKYAIKNHLERSGFDNVECSARNENNFFNYNIKFKSRYPEWDSLRPLIKIECINIPLFMETSCCEITSIADEYLDISGEHGTFECQNVNEVLVEKVLATLRRLTDDREYYFANPNLMRHIYDVSQIVAAGVTYTAEMSEVFYKKIEKEISMYGGHCAEFANNPKLALINSLNSLNTDPKYREDYEKQIYPMLFDYSNADFDYCLKNFIDIASNLI